MQVRKNASQERLSGNVRFEWDENVPIWIVEDLADAINTGELEEGESHFLDVAGQSDVTGAVVVLEDTGTVGSDTLEYVSERWTELGEQTAINRTAYVSDGLARLAVANKNEASGMEASGFKDLEEAIGWASQA